MFVRRGATIATFALAALPAAFDNVVTRRLGIDIPIVQAPMGWITSAHRAAGLSPETTSMWGVFVSEKFAG